MSTEVSKCNQVVFELLCKVAELIVSAKVSLHQQKRPTINSKFSLHVQELDVVRNSMKAWENNLTMPLGIDIFWEEHRRGDAAPRKELLERWEIMYESKEGIGSKSSQLRHFFKRSIILLRTIYSFVRLLPAYSDDTGFCLYPGGSGGSGLSFSDTSGSEEAGQSGRSAMTSCHAFKPLEAPNGSVKVVCQHRRGVDSEAYQRGHTGNERTNPTPDMTTSLIQDYVPDQYERSTTFGRAPSSEVNRDSRLPSTPEDRASMPRGQTGSFGENAQEQRQRDLGNASASMETGAYVEADPLVRDSGENDTMPWPSPDSGHGYAERRVSKHVGQGPAPFLTPGPHRGRILGLSNMNMEPLELGPNARSDARGSLQLSSEKHEEQDDVHEVGDPPRYSSEEAVGSMEVPGSAMVRTIGGGHGLHARDMVRPYRRNSISESSSTPPVLSFHGARHTAGRRHGTSAESTPPFSYCDSVSSDASPLTLGQPLVSFSPPFDAAHAGPHRNDSTLGLESNRALNSSSLFGMRVHHPRSSGPVLETLPESPFSWKSNREGTQRPAVTSPTSFSRSLLPSSLAKSCQEPTLETYLGADRPEGLPFSADTRHRDDDDGRGALVESSNLCGEGALDSSSPLSTLFALCSATSKSVSLMHNTPVDSTSRDRDAKDATAFSSSYASSAGMNLPPEFVARSLEEDLEVFRHFQEELEQKRRPV